MRMRLAVFLCASVVGACGALLGTSDDDDVDRPIREDDAGADVIANDVTSTDAVADSSSDAPLDVKADADAAPPKKHVFTTSQRYAGAFDGGRLGADALCTQLANAAGHAGTYKAYLAEADGGHPSLRIAARTYVRFDGTVVFPNGPAAGVAPLQPLAIAENGQAVGFDGTTKYAWTGLEPTTMPSQRTCEGWTGGSGVTAFGGRGDLTAFAGNSVTADDWQQSFGTDSCTATNRLFCFED